MTGENANIPEQLGKLKVLQALDTDIFDVKSRKEEIPVRIKEMDEILAGKEGGMKAAEEELKRLQVTKNAKENDMKAKEEKTSKHEAELYQIKNNKEYSALQKEIDSIKADISLLEEEILKYFDDIEAAQARLDDEKKAFEEEKKKADREKGLIKEEEKQLTDRLTELTAKRSEAAGGVEQDILEQYEKILKLRGRTALAAVKDHSCSECNMTLRPQVINEAQMKKQIVYCENCSRILYAED